MKYAIGIDIGGTKIDTILYDGKHVRREVILKTAKNKKKFLKQVEESIHIVSSGFKKSEIKGIGIGVPSVFDEKKEKIVSSPNLKFLEGFPIKQHIKKKFGLRVEFENDVGCMALAESEIGQEKNVKNMVCLALGTGIGGGIIINNKIYTGRSNAPEPGHQTINENGIKCSCGNYGCLEEYFSARAFSREAKKQGLPENIIELEKIAKQGNRKAKNIYQELGKHLGVGISNIIKILDPDMIVLGGGISNASSLFLPSALKEVKRRMHFKPCKIVVTEMKSAGAIGAALLI